MITAPSEARNGLKVTKRHGVTARNVFHLLTIKSERKYVMKCNSVKWRLHTLPETCLVPFCRLQRML
jgi:hypothetical protein